VLLNQVREFQEHSILVWFVDCTSSSVGSWKTKSSKETYEHGKSKAGEKGKEAGNSEAVEPLQAIDQVLTL
jgi:hypothetical protein